MKTLKNQNSDKNLDITKTATDKAPKVKTLKPATRPQKSAKNDKAPKKSKVKEPAIIRTEISKNKYLCNKEGLAEMILSDALWARIQCEKAYNTLDSEKAFICTPPEPAILVEYEFFDKDEKLFNYITSDFIDTFYARVCSFGYQNALKKADELIEENKTYKETDLYLYDLDNKLRVSF